MCIICTHPQLPRKTPKISSAEDGDRATRGGPQGIGIIIFYKRILPGAFYAGNGWVAEGCWDDY